jgi:hypothetical protein
MCHNGIDDMMSCEQMPKAGVATAEGRDALPMSFGSSKGAAAAGGGAAAGKHTNGTNSNGIAMSKDQKAKDKAAKRAKRRTQRKNDKKLNIKQENGIDESDDGNDGNAADGSNVQYVSEALPSDVMADFANVMAKFAKPEDLTAPRDRDADGDDDDTANDERKAARKAQRDAEKDAQAAKKLRDSQEPKGLSRRERKVMLYVLLQSIG